jgi:hypothetical protein
MKSTIKVMVKEQISVDLALRHSAAAFLDYLESVPQKEVIVDFSGINSISRSFAHEYLTRKNNSKKNITEINVPENVKKMFYVIEQPTEKSLVFDLRKVRAVTL